ncbi:hypothetical protein JG687_00010414 [Phytophthora cactorum]|uniref:Uncharacterized protein n=1 Tax=Phytophthora cactorum TaxID=29920 RepID=A0A8T1U9L9_9STRA|nr:hypothetical protein JG687_00010414 [Phytophthora cactorum]
MLPALTAAADKMLVQIAPHTYSRRDVSCGLTLRENGPSTRSRRLLRTRDAAPNTQACTWQRLVQVPSVFSSSH